MSTSRVDSAGARARRRRRQQDVEKPQVFVFGEIEGAVPMWPLVRLYCSWRLIFDDTKWSLLQGEAQGETFLSSVSDQGFCAWNHPISVQFGCKSVQGWPRLEMVVRGSDSHGRHQLAGYCSWAVPTTPGAKEVVCRCWRPTGSTLLERLRMHLLGIVPELQETTILSRGGFSRAGLRTEDSVDVLLRINVIHKHFKQNGIYVSGRGS